MKDNAMTTDSFPLSGVRVIDFTQVMLGHARRRCWRISVRT